MPPLDASKEALPDIYLQQATTVLGMMTYAYVRLEGHEPISLKYESQSVILPKCFEVPWIQVCQRLSRDYTHVNPIDGVLANFFTSSRSRTEMTLENTQILVPDVRTLEEHNFLEVIIEVNAKAIPAVH